MLLLFKYNLSNTRRFQNALKYEGIISKTWDIIKRAIVTIEFGITNYTELIPNKSILVILH